MIFDVTSEYGHIKLGRLYINWANQSEGFTGECPGYFCLGYGNRNIELGQIDQECPGIYFTEYEEGDVARSYPLLQFNQPKQITS